MTSISDLVIAPIAADLVVCLAEELAKTPTTPSSPRPVCLRPGDRVDLLISQTGDECCQGLSWVRWVTMYPSASGPFPDPDGGITCDVRRWAVTFELGAVRCSPTPGPDTFPSCDEWTETTLALYDDLAAIRRAVCCYKTREPYRLVSYGTAEPITTEGGCTGVTMTVTVSAQPCDCGS